MPNYQQAEKLATAWVDILLDGRAAIMPEHTITRPYGWVFFYQSKEYIADQKFEHMLVGNAPIIVDRIDGEIRVTGTARPTEEYLAEYEASLPVGRLKMKPEFPPRAI
jgi:hypothetical protein